MRDSEMLKTPEGFFSGNDFQVQIIARGTCEDQDAGRVYGVETITLRVNNIAQNEWYNANGSNCRDCYNTQEEWWHIKKRRKYSSKLGKPKLKQCSGWMKMEKTAAFVSSKSWPSFSR